MSFPRKYVAALALFGLLTPWRSLRRYRCHGHLLACGEVDPWPYEWFLQRYANLCHRELCRVLDLPYERSPSIRLRYRA